MSEVVNSVLIRGGLEPVYNLVTTTSSWPRWHPATTDVGGVTERPLQLGDQVFERAEIHGRVHEGVWAVTECEPPTRLTLQIGDGRIQITYTCEAQGDQIRLTRALSFRPQDFAGGDTDPDGVIARMGAQSEVALRQLKTFVEETLITA